MVLSVNAGNGILRVAELENPATRCQATKEMREILRRAAQRELRVLAGFDFPLGYPGGFAKRLGITEQPAWLAVWREIASYIIDREDNSNNRFEVAADFNRRISGGYYPFGLVQMAGSTRIYCRQSARREN